MSGWACRTALAVVAGAALAGPPDCEVWVVPADGPADPLRLRGLAPCDWWAAPACPQGTEFDGPGGARLVVEFYGQAVPGNRLGLPPGGPYAVCSGPGEDDWRALSSRALDYYLGHTRRHP